MKKIDTAIIVGKFMQHALTDSQIEAITHIDENYSSVIVFLGLSPLKNNMENPLEFKHRKSLFADAGFTKIQVHYIDDNRDDVVWSETLDKQIKKYIGPAAPATVFGSIDGVANKYTGKYPKQSIEPATYQSFQRLHREMAVSYPNSRDFRAGMIVACTGKYPTAYQTVDIAIINDKKQVLLVKKPKESQWRFPGGFSDPNSVSLEADARRETMEETGVEISDPIYIGSTLIDDWRYKTSTDKIKTVLFVAKYVFGRPKGSDDVELVKWFDMADLYDGKEIVYEHHILVKMFFDKYELIEPQLFPTK